MYMFSSCRECSYFWEVFRVHLFRFQPGFNSVVTTFLFFRFQGLFPIPFSIRFQPWAQGRAVPQACSSQCCPTERHSATPSHFFCFQHVFNTFTSRFQQPANFQVRRSMPGCRGQASHSRSFFCVFRFLDCSLDPLPRNVISMF